MPLLCAKRKCRRHCGWGSLGAIEKAANAQRSPPVMLRMTLSPQGGGWARAHHRT